MVDYSVFIDTIDRSIKCEDAKTGSIISSHPTNADVPMQAAIDALSAGQILGAGDDFHLWPGGKKGRIFVQPGVYDVRRYIILKPHITIQGCGCWSTIFKLADNIFPATNNNTVGVFKSSTWDTLSLSTDVAALKGGDLDVTLRDFQIYGNWKNNPFPVNSQYTQTTPIISGVETAGVDSWGHGLAYYGFGLRMDNIIAHGCPGAGIIIQGPTPQLGSGYPYPLTTYWPPGSNPVHNTGTGAYDRVCYVTNCRSFANGRQGLLARQVLYVSNLWTYYNGEAGIDVQLCQYFGGNCFFNGIELCLDGANHGDSKSTEYDPLGFECRLNGSWVCNAWIEGPWGMGDNLVIGSNGTCAQPAAGYQIYGAVSYGSYTNMILDAVRASGIFIGPLSHFHNISNTKVIAYYRPDVILYPGVTPLRELGSYNDIEITYHNFRDNPAAGITTTGVVIGRQSPSVGVLGDRLTLHSVNNDYAIDNQNLGNYNNICLTLVNFTGQKQYVLKPGSVAPDYTKNHINVEVLSTSPVGLLSHNGGTATLTANGSSTIFSIPHSLFDTPNVYSARPKNAAAITGGAYYTTADATNVTLTFSTAPRAGTMSFVWEARICP